MTWKFFGASALKLIVASRPLSLATATLNLNEVVAVPRSDGKLVVSLSLAGSSWPIVTVIGSFSVFPSTLRLDEELIIAGSRTRRGFEAQLQLLLAIRRDRSPT